MMSFNLYPRHNGALHANPPAGDAHITTHASDWLWAVFSIMLLSWCVVFVWTLSSQKFNRIQHIIPLVVLSVSTIAYFCMASDLGWTLIRSEYDGHPTRQVFYVRYIQWFINAPLILLLPLAFTALATPQLLLILFFSWFLVINGLIGALVASSYKWAFYAFGIFALFFIWYMLLGHVHLFAFRREDYRARYFFGAAYISFFWLPYPICWGLSEGSNTISPTSEMVFYGILDIFAGPVFLFLAIVALARFDTRDLGETGFGNAERGFYGEAPQRPQPVQPGQTKQPPPPPPTENASAPAVA